MNLLNKHEESQGMRWRVFVYTDDKSHESNQISKLPLLDVESSDIMELLDEVGPVT